MFIIDDLIFWGVASGGVAYGVAEYRSGFRRTKGLYRRVVGVYDRAVNGPPTPAKKVEMLLSGYASRVDGVRSGLSTLVANHRQSVKISEEQQEAAGQARELADQALKNGDEDTAEQAMMVAVNADERAELYRENAVRYQELAKTMEEELAYAEADLDMAQTSADTVRVHADIAEMNKQLYEIISDVSKDSGGWSMQGQLKQLVESTERDAIASSVKVDLARGSQAGGARHLRLALKDNRVKQGLEEARERIGLAALPEPREEGDAEPDDEDHPDLDSDAVDAEGVSEEPGQADLRAVSASGN